MDFKQETRELLFQFYSLLDPEAIPQKRTKQLWEDENRFGFFRGILLEGCDEDVLKLKETLMNGNFINEQYFSKADQKMRPDFQPTLADVFFNLYIGHFHKDYKVESLASSQPSKSKEALDDQAYIDATPNPTNFKKALMKRDGVCLFCWNNHQLQGAHIVSQKLKEFSYNESEILQRTGLSNVNQVQNGLLLCIMCHAEFDILQRYIDIENDSLIVKIVNKTNDPKDLDWIEASENLKDNRYGKQKRIFPDRQSVNSNDQMQIYFMSQNANDYPNQEALKFHKAACLIWKMAGGAEEEEEFDDDESDFIRPVSIQEKRLHFTKWLDSTLTLTD